MKLEQHKNVFYKNIGTYMALINNELKKEYPLEPLSNHIKMVGGYAFKSSHYLSEGIPVIRISDFQNEKIELTGVKYYEESEKLDRYELIAGDVIIAMTGGTIGKLAIVQEGLGKLYLNQRVGKFQVLNPNEFEDEYVYWLARGIQDIVQNLGYGGAQPNVSNKQVEALEFAFPERKIQRKIIAFLNDLKENKTNRHYFNANVESKISNIQNTSVKLNTIKNDAVLNELFISKLKDSILQEAVQGKLTVDWRTNNPNIEDASVLLNLIQKQKAQLIKDKKIKKEKLLPSITKEEIPYELPKGWSWCRFQKLQDYGTKISYGVLVPGPHVEDGIPLVRVGDITKGIKGVLPNKFIAHEIEAKYKRTRLEGGEILIVVVGSIGTVTIAHENWKGSNVARAVSRTILNPKVSKEYFVNVIRSSYMQSYFEECTRTVAQPTLNIGLIEMAMIPLPPLLEQKAIVQKVNTLISLCDGLEQQVQQIQEQSDKLLQSVMRESLEGKSTF